MTSPSSRAKTAAAGLALGLTAGFVLGSIIFATPFLFWAYHIHRAGSVMEQGLAWPETRYADSLPSWTDAQDPAKALVHLARAQHWRARHFHGYRLEARIYMALGQWLEAETAIAQARQRAPRNPLVHFDGVLIYEQMMRALEADAGVPVWPQTVAVPDGPVVSLPDTVCIGAAEATACNFIYDDQVTLPVADLAASGLTWPAPFLGARGAQPLEFAVDLPAQTTGLSFLMAAHPDVPAAAPISLSIQVRTGTGPEFTTVSEHVLPSGHSGWVPGQVSLAAWTGETLHVRMQADVEGGYAGWGQLSITDEDTSELLARTPLIRWQEALLAGNFRSSDMMALAAEAENRGDTGRSEAWQRRASFLEAQESPGG